MAAKKGALQGCVRDGRRKQPPQKRRRGRALAVGAGVLALMLFGSGLWWGATAFRLRINGESVTAEEYLQAMNAQKYAVSAELSAQYGLQGGAGFWTSMAGDKPAYQVLATRTLEALTQRRALYTLGQERGYVEDASYAGLLARMEQENATRAEKIANGETVYGVEQFTVETTLRYEESAIRTRYCDDPLNSDMAFAEETLLAQYEETKEPRFRREDNLSLVYIQVAYEQDGLESATVQALRDKLSRLAGTSGALYELAMEDPTLAPYTHKRQLAHSDYRSASKDIPELLALTVGLTAGGRTAVVEESGVLYLLECVARTSGGYTPYEEARDYIVKSMREDAFAARVNQRAQATVLQCNMESIYRLTKKFV